MKVLLDTHALIWFGINSPNLSSIALACLENGETQVYFSVASIWEMTIKHQLGKLQLGQRLDGRFRRHLLDQGMLEIEIQFQHVAFTGNLPFHHRDPFDRLLVAQALVEGMSLVSHESTLDAYPVHRIW